MFKELSLKAICTLFVNHKEILGREKQTHLFKRGGGDINTN